MTTAYKLRTTIAVPESHIPDANQLALATGESSADDRTFGAARYQDADGNLYAICSTVAKLVFVEKSKRPLQAPDHAPDVDLEAAGRAQELLIIEDRTSGTDPVQASPNHIAVIIDSRLASAQQHIGSMGLTLVPSEEEM